MDTFGKRIKRLRKEQGFTQTELAKLLGKSLRTVQKYESDEIDLSLSVIFKIAEVLSTSAEYLIFGKTNGELCFNGGNENGNR